MKFTPISSIFFIAAIQAKCSIDQAAILNVGANQECCAVGQILDLNGNCATAPTCPATFILNSRGTCCGEGQNLSSARSCVDKCDINLFYVTGSGACIAINPSTQAIDPASALTANDTLYVNAMVYYNKLTNYQQSVRTFVAQQAIQSAVNLAGTSADITANAAVCPVKSITLFNVATSQVCCATGQILDSAGNCGGGQTCPAGSNGRSLRGECCAPFQFSALYSGFCEDFCPLGQTFAGVGPVCLCLGGQQKDKFSKCCSTPDQILVDGVCTTPTFTGVGSIFPTTQTKALSIAIQAMSFHMQFQKILEPQIQAQIFVSAKNYAGVKKSGTTSVTVSQGTSVPTNAIFPYGSLPTPTGPGFNNSTYNRNNTNSTSGSYALEKFGFALVLFSQLF